MGVSILDGTIEEAELKRSVRNIRIFHHIRFRLADGSTKSVAKPIVHADVARHLQRGASGRFYLYTSIDQRGIHGIRDDKGEAAFAFPKNNENAMLGLAIFTGLWMGISIAAVQDAPLIGTIIFVLSVPYYFYLRSLRGQARRQFESDRAFAVPAAPRLEPEPAVGA